MHLEFIGGYQAMVYYSHNEIKDETCKACQNGSCMQKFYYVGGETYVKHATLGELS